MLRFKYDREADILHINKCPPYAEQESEELPDEIVARLNPKTGEVENLEMLFFPAACQPRAPLMHRGGDDPAQAQGHGSGKDRRSHVALLHNLLPEI
jgi:hypothetical protein